MPMPFTIGRKIIDRLQIEQALGFLGQKLADMQIKTAIVLLGGALMVTQIGNRKSTQDINIIEAKGKKLCREKG